MKPLSRKKKKTKERKEKKIHVHTEFFFSQSQKKENRKVPAASGYSILMSKVKEKKCRSSRNFLFWELEDGKLKQQCDKRLKIRA